MMVRRKQIPVWKAQDIGVESAQLEAHTEITGLSVPVRKTECEIISGDTPGEATVNLALKLGELI
jgi:hypothetical protein